MCAEVHGLDWPKLESCVVSAQGTELLQTSRKEALGLIADQETAEAKQTANQFTGAGGSTVVSGGRRLLASSPPTTSLFFSDINPFTQASPPPPSIDEPEVATLRNPPVAIVDGSVYAAATWDVHDFTRHLCQSLTAQPSNHDLADEAIWAWLAGSALAISSALAGIAVGCLYHFEESWKADDAFSRPPDPHPNRYQLVQLDSKGQVDETYERNVGVPNMPYLNATWAQGSHKKFMPDIEYEHNFRGMIHEEYVPTQQEVEG